MKVYVTVPTNRESGVHPDLVQWLLTLPPIDGVTWMCDIVRGKPVVSNRNATVHRFLASDADVFFTIDDDMVPTIPDDPQHGGIRQLIEDIKKPEVDCLTAVALKGSANGHLPVIMKMVEPYKQRVYHEILSQPKGLYHMESGAAGAASLMAKRKVMERFQAEEILWFKDEFYEGDDLETSDPNWGTRKLGQDAWFWKHSEAFGFKNWVDTRVHWGHVKMCDLRSEFNREQSNRATEMRMRRLPLCFAESARRLWGNTDFSASSEFMVESLMYAADVPSDQMIVECGSGVSSLALSMILTPDRYVVYEHSKEWRDYAVDKIDYLAEVILTCPLHDCGEYEWYKRKVDPHSPVGLLIVDGPPDLTTKGGRYGALPEMYPFLAPKFRVMLDDVHREQESSLMELWSKEYGLAIDVRATGDGRQFAIMEGSK